MRPRSGACLAVVASLSALSALQLQQVPRERVYRLIPGRGRVEVRVKTDGLVNPGRGLVLRARTYSGRVTANLANPAAGRVELRVPVLELVPVEPRMTTLEQADVVDWIRSTWGLDAARSREISFVASGVSVAAVRTDGLVLDLPGRLEIRRRGHAERVRAVVQLRSDGVTASGRHVLRLRDYGIIPYRDATGVYRIRNEVEVSFSVFAAPASE